MCYNVTRASAGKASTRRPQARLIRPLRREWLQVFPAGTSRQDFVRLGGTIKRDSLASNYGLYDEMAGWSRTILHYSM